VTPFTYPTAPLARKHDPLGYLDYNSFRPWLRDEFCFRCVYCLRRERWEPDCGVFEIDHLSPVSLSPELRVAYRNLIYSCTTCNSAKRAQPLPDPSVVFTSSSLAVEPDGNLSGRTEESSLLIRLLDLNDPMFVTWRMRMIRIVALAGQHDPELFLSLMAYPDGLPNLATLRPPGGNGLPEGILQSHFERRKRGELLATY
jgi:HNH endonuclease